MGTPWNEHAIKRAAARRAKPHPEPIEKPKRGGPDKMRYVLVTWGYDPCDDTPYLAMMRQELLNYRRTGSIHRTRADGHMVFGLPDGITAGDAKVLLARIKDGTQQVLSGEAKGYSKHKMGRISELREQAKQKQREGRSSHDAA